MLDTGRNTMIEIGRTIPAPNYDVESERADLTDEWLSVVKDNADGVYALFAQDTGNTYGSDMAIYRHDDIALECDSKLVAFRVEYVGRTIFVGPDLIGRVWGSGFIRRIEREENEAWYRAAD